MGRGLRVVQLALRLCLESSHARPNLLDHAERGLALSHEVLDLGVEPVQVCQLAAEVRVGALEPGMIGFGVDDGRARGVERGLECPP